MTQAALNESTPKGLFLHSVRRCVDNEEFIPAFYERFLSTSDEIRDMFRNTDFEAQTKKMCRSLMLSAEATIGKPHALEELHERAMTHNRHHLNIEPRLYEFWLESMVTTAKEFDEEWDDAVETAWREILGFVVNYMTRKY